MASQELVPYITPVLVDRLSIALRFIGSPESVAPSHHEHLLAADEQKYRKQSLLILGALGETTAYDQLDDWLRFPTAKNTAHEQQYETGSHNYRTLILAAGRHACKKRNEILPHALKNSVGRGTNEQRFRNEPLFKRIRDNTSLDYVPEYNTEQQQLARVSIFAVALYQNRVQRAGLPRTTLR